MRALKITLISLGVLIGVVVSAFAVFLIYVSIGSDQTLARNIKVASDWSEIAANPAVSAHRRHQNISLQIAGIDWDSKFDGDIHLNDGTVLRPEVELVDEAGMIQPLRLSGFSRQGALIRADFRPVRDTNGFVEGRKFTQARIRSDIPFECIQILWIDYDPK